MQSNLYKAHKENIRRNSAMNGMKNDEEEDNEEDNNDDDETAMEPRQNGRGIKHQRSHSSFTSGDSKHNNAKGAAAGKDKRNSINSPSYVIDKRKQHTGGLNQMGSPDDTVMVTPQRYIRLYHTIYTTPFLYYPTPIICHPLYSPSRAPT